MKLTPRHKKNLRIAMPFLVALMLALAILPAAVLAQPPNIPGGPGGNPNTGPGNDPNSPGGNPPGGQPTAVPTAVPTAPTGGPNTGGPNTGGPNTGGPNTGGPNTGPPGATPTAVPTAVPSAQPHPDAPFTPPANCIVAHAATPAQVCPVGGGLQYYFIGADGGSSQGPWIAPFGQLTASVYSGVNPRTGKSVTITYLAAENKIRISTFYPDNEYDTNKPYNFTVDANNNVAHEAW